jgi:hypothetical protein
MKAQETVYLFKWLFPEEVQMKKKKSSNSIGGGGGGV